MYKQGIGYSSFKDKSYKNGFIRETTHEKYIFVVKKPNPSKWIQRDRFGNSRIRPTKIWIPKTLLSSIVGT